jgi:hypothetical protein
MRISGQILIVLVRFSSNNLSIPEPFPDPVPSMAKIGTGVNLLRVRNAESASGDRQKVRECKEARGQLDTMMEQLRTYAELKAQGDQAILESTGFELRQPPHATGAGSSLLPAPTEFRVTHGRLSGTLDAHVRGMEGCKSYDVQTMPGNGNPATDWAHATSSTSSMHILLEGFTPGQYVWVRVRGLNNAGFGLWTEPIKIMVI